MTLVQLTRYFLPGMVERRHGSVLNLSSVAAFSAGPRMCLYYASKEFVRSFSEAVAEEVRSTGVTVTALCPGPTATGFEQAAQMKNSHMFSMFKPASAAAVAEAGFRAAQKGKTLRYCGWPTHTAVSYTHLNSCVPHRRGMRSTGSALWRRALQHDQGIRRVCKEIGTVVAACVSLSY